MTDTPLVCPNGHAMDEGYFECPCCGAFRPSASGLTAKQYESALLGAGYRQPQARALATARRRSATIHRPARGMGGGRFPA